MKAYPSLSASELQVLRRKRSDQRLHKIYHRGAGISHFLARRCRPAGIALGLVFVLSACLGIGHSRSSIYQLFSLCMGMVIIGVPWAMSRRATVEAKREMPRFATAGEPLRYTVRVWQHGKRRLGQAWLADTPPDPRPSLEDFSILREPGEEERNAFDRRFAYFRWQWLLMRNRLFTGGFGSNVLDLKRGEELRQTLDSSTSRQMSTSPPMAC